jgi:hypothetical protein
MEPVELRKILKDNLAEIYKDREKVYILYSLINALQKGDCPSG